MTYDAIQFAQSCNPRAEFSHHFLDGEATLTNGDTMPVDYVTDHELRTYKVVEAYCPAEHRWLKASKVKL